MQSWLSGWRDFFNFASVSGYRDCEWLERKRIDHIALWLLLGSSQFRCAVLLLIAVQILVMSAAWHFDLGGWPRDLLRCAPALLAVPWFAAARKAAVEVLLCSSD